jgi:hypothetical protein
MAEVQLTQRDIDYISRVVDTEVPPSLARTNPAEYERMVQAVVDTVTNRVASEQFPNRTVDVLNQDRQFSKISGPSRLDPYGSVQNAPRASQRAQDAVYDYVAARAQGAPRTAGGAVNYANPRASDQRNLTSWIDPMIAAGAQAFGVGNATHYHGNAPGMRSVDEYSLRADNMPSGNIPTPTFRDDIPGQSASATGIMAAIDPATPMDVERGGLLGAPSAPYDMSLFGYDEPTFDAGRFGPEPTAPAQAMASAAPAAPASTPSPTYDMSMFGWDEPSFDMGRFGPEQPAQTAAFDYGRFGPEPTTPAVAFDYGRFGPEITAPTAVAAAPMASASLFDMERFGTPAPVAQGYAGLQRGLLDQQLNVGILPNIPAPITTASIAPVTQPQTPYRDPMVSAQPAKAAQPIGGQSARSAGRSMSAPAVNTGFMGRNNPALNDFGVTGRGILGGLGGAILGGALLGPVGGIVGGLLGRNYGQSSYYPSAPAPIPGQPQNSGGGYESLSEYGQQAYSDSPQFAEAVDSGSVGLW